MSKTVKFDVQDFDKKTSIMDTMSNVKKVSDGLRKMYKAIDKVDEEKGEDALLVDYSDALRPVLVEDVAEILGLSKTEAKKLENVSYSDLEKFYSNLCDEFIGLQMPTLQRMLDQMQQAQAMAQNQTEKDSDLQLVDPKPTADK